MSCNNYNEKESKKEHICVYIFPGDSVAKNPPAMREMELRSLSGEDPLEEEMATHSSILA